MNKENQNILVLAPHTDDGELGAGGYISKLIREGHAVSYVAFSSCEESLPDGLPKDTLVKEVRSATKTLGIEEKNLTILPFKVREFGYSRQKILDEIIGLRSNNYFSIVLIPSINDVHQDHNVIANEAVRAFKNSSTILSYDLPWNNPSFNSQCFVKLLRSDVDKKYEALRCYKSQENRPYMQKENIYALTRYKGMQMGCEFAESFEVVRWFID